MCEANAFLERDGVEDLVMTNVDVMRLEGEQVYIRDIFGEQLWLRAHIKELNLVEHRILLEENNPHKEVAP